MNQVGDEGKLTRIYMEVFVVGADKNPLLCGLNSFEEVEGSAGCG